MIYLVLFAAAIAFIIAFCADRDNSALRSRIAVLESVLNDTADKRKMNAVIIAQPTIERRKSGSWILGDDHMTCPVCGAKWRYTENETGLFDFCPVCGMEVTE